MNTDADTARLDAMIDAEAERHLDRIWNVVPEVVEAVEAGTLIASPLAGPVRILREVVATTGWHEPDIRG